MKTSSWWQTEPGPASFPILEGDRETEVVVVGAGITGLTTALLLARGGREVTLLEGEHIAAGTTGHTSAHLTVETDTDLDELRRRVGDEAARAAVQANRKGIERIASFDRELAGRGDFARVPGFLWSDRDRDLQRIEAMAKLYTEYGEPATALVDVPLPNRPRGMRLEDQGVFHPVRYLAGLAELAAREGVAIHEGSEVVDWDSGTPVRVVTRTGTVRAEHVVFATHTPPGLVPSVQMRLEPNLSFLIVVRPRTAVLPALYWDMEDPYHYVRPLDDGRLLVGGGDFAPGRGDPYESLRKLEEWARDVLHAGDVSARWSHMWFEPADGMPYVGALPLRLGAWVATGFSGTGLTWGTFAAERLADQILGHESADDRFFSPGRLALAGSVDRVVKDQAAVAWHLVIDRLRPTGDHHPADLRPGEGGILTVEGQRVGVYRDDTGELHAVSTVCRHLGCEVGWNALDRTWDCPCHGGRYHADGTRFYGPPMQDLDRRVLGPAAEERPARRRKAPRRAPTPHPRASRARKV